MQVFVAPVHHSHGLKGRASEAKASYRDVGINNLLDDKFFIRKFHPEFGPRSPIDHMDMRLVSMAQGPEQTVKNDGHWLRCAPHELRKPYLPPNVVMLRVLN
eukprot:502798-Prymnesium_polylepis.1